jgi:GH25 family lysozyme M1 (1,4-beta-N-acetylmuramidase)
MLKGIDISHWQGQPDFDKVKDQINFVIIKATEGVGYTDPELTRNQSEIRRVGLGLGYYHFARPEYNSAEAEADYFTSKINIQEGEVVVLDYESNWTGDPVKWSLAFLKRVEENLNGIKPFIYMNKGLKKRHDWSSVVLGGYGLWLADYEGSGTSTPWAFTAITQTSDSGKIDGVPSNTVDLDVFYGDIKAFKSFGYRTMPSINSVLPWENIDNFDQNPNAEYYKNKYHSNDWSIIGDINDRDIEIAEYKKTLETENSVLSVQVEELQNEVTITKQALADNLVILQNLQKENFELRTKEPLTVTDSQIIVNTPNLNKTEKTILTHLFNFVVERIQKLFSTRLWVAIGGSGAVMTILNNPQDQASVTAGIIAILGSVISYIYSETQIKK